MSAISLRSQYQHPVLSVVPMKYAVNRLWCLGHNLAIAGHLRGAYIRGHIFACADLRCHCDYGDLRRIESDGIDE